MGFVVRGLRPGEPVVSVECGLRGKLAHVQVNDPNRQGPGQGAMRFAPILAALQAVGYDGVLAVEPFDYRPDGPGCAARAIGYLRGLLEARDG